MAQDVVGIQNSDLTLLVNTEARFRLGGEQGRWEARVLLFTQRDSSFRTYSSTLGAVELVYNSDHLGYFSGQVFYLSLRGARAGGLFRLEWQKLWTDKPLAPLLRFTQERLHVVDLAAQERLLINWRSRLSVGLAPPLSPRLRLIAMVEWFPHQRYGFSKEYRSVSGLSFTLTPAVTLTLAHLGRLQTYEEAQLRWQHTVYFSARYTGVVSKHSAPSWALID